MHNAYDDPYARKKTAHIKRKEFEKIKNTRSFKLWRQRQEKVQNNQCAYCKIDLSRDGIITHIDHVTPLYYDGKNDFSNYVLSCKRCNTKKWIDDRYVVPDWIKRNDADMRNKQRMKLIRQKQKRQIQEIIDQSIYDEIMRHI